MPGAGLEPARATNPRDFKSLASTNSATRAIKLIRRFIPIKAAPGFEPGYCGFADRCLTSWLRRHLLKAGIMY